MKRQYQRFIPCLLCAALLVFLFAVPVNAAETSGTCGEDATWTLVDGVLTISGTGKTWDFRDDASRFDYHPCPWEEIKDEIRQVIVEEGITYLGAGAFMECANLERVSLPESLTVLESFAFYFCRKLSECELPSHLESIGQENFERSAIRSVTIPASVTFLGAGIYALCLNLESVYIEGDPDAAGYMYGSGLFWGCTALQGIEVEEDHIALCSVDGVLFDKSRTALVAFPAGYRQSSYRIPSGTKTILQQAFDVSNGEEDGVTVSLLIIPASVTEIGNLNNLHWIHEVRFEGDAPEGVGYALEFGFADDRPLTVYYPKDNPTWDEVIAEAAGREEITWVPEETLAVTVQPENVTAAPGESVKFIVAASGTDLSYQWQYSADEGKTWKDSPATGSQTAELTVPATADSSGYQYRCVVRSGSAEVTSDAATLTVKEETPVPAAPAITAQPKSVTVTAGGSVNFTVAASGDDLSYQWEVSADGGKTWKDSPVTGNQTATLTVPATASRSGNQYRCVVRSGSAEVTSDAATLTVTEETTTVPAAPEITVKAASGKNTVKWGAVSGATKYEVYRSLYENKSWKKIATVKDAVSYADSSVNPGTKYYYRVRAYGGGGWGAYSAVVSAKASALTPATVKARIKAYFDAVTAGKTNGAYWNNKLVTKDLKNLKNYADGVSEDACKTASGKYTPRSGDNNHNVSGPCQSNNFKGAADAWTSYMAGIRNDNKSARVKAKTFWSYSGGGTQCSGFADYMLYVIFGSVSRGDYYYAENYNSIFTKDYTFQPGDLIRYGGHSVVVYKVSGDKVSFIECNYGKNCIIRMNDRTMSAGTLRSKIVSKPSTTNKGKEKNYILIPKAKLRSGDNASNAKVPGVVSAVTVKATEGKIELTWAKAENAVLYKIRRREKDGDAWGAWTTLIFDVDGTTYTDMTVVAGKQYQYEVRGANGEEYGSYTLSVGVKAK